VIDAAALAKMQPGSYLINTARAQSVNKAAVIAALRSGHLGGAGFDVFHEEPLKEDDELFSLDNVIMTPHLAGAPRSNALEDMAEMLEGLAAVVARGA